MPDDATTPEGALIRGARESRNLNYRQAAENAGLSATRWRQIETGWQSGGEGQWTRVKAPAGTLATMASVVGITPQQLRDAGRHDAADALEREMVRRPDGPTLGDLIDQAIHADPVAGTIEILGLMQRALDRNPPGNGGPPVVPRPRGASAVQPFLCPT